MSTQGDPLLTGAAPSLDAVAGVVHSMDAKVLLTRVDGDRALLKELVDLFLEECPKRIGEIRAALAHHDSSGLASAAHGLKGTLSYFAAGAAADAARRLELMGREGDLTHAETACASLEEALGHLTGALGALAEEGPG